MDAGKPDLSSPYFHERVRRALAEDDRVGETTIRVSHSSGGLWLTGTVANESRRRAALELVRELAGEEVMIHNQLEILEVNPEPTVEDLS